MKTIKLVVIGGCHVVGYPIGETLAFPRLLSEQVDGKILKVLPHIKLTRLPEHLKVTSESKPSHVIIQVGNHELSDSLQQLLLEMNKPLGKSSIVSRKSFRASSSSSASSQDEPDFSLAGTQQRATGLRYMARVGTLGALTTVLWSLSRRYRQAFNALNEHIKQHPETTFIVISPLPSLNPTLNTLRQLGSWLFRRRLHDTANMRWLDSHALIQASEKHFVDDMHLNERAHQMLADKIASVLLPSRRYAL